MNPEFLEYQAIVEPCSEYGKGIAYQSMMKMQIRKHSSYLQPIFEAISNALESSGVTNIELSIATTKTLHSDYHEFCSIHITDDGIGFNEDNFNRFVTLFDDSKGFNNFGTGRIQFLHYFKYTQIRSVYEVNGEKRLREIVLSNAFYERYHTSILTNDKVVDSATPITTTISFFQTLAKEDKSAFQNITTDSLKHEVLTHYLSKFCLNRERMPLIKISKYINQVEDSECTRFLSSEDIPSPDYQKEVDVQYSTVSDDGKEIIRFAKKAKFQIQSFPLPTSVINRNEVKLTSKGESVDARNFDFSLIKEAPQLGDSYMLFLISSMYLTEHDQDERGKLKLFSKKELLSSHNLFPEPQIVIEDIQDTVVDSISTHYPMIKKAKEQHELDLQEMADFFSLDFDEIKQLGVRVGDTTEAILKRYHEYNGNIQAKKEAQVKTLYDSLLSLTPGHKSYNAELNKRVKSLTTLMPAIVRANLTGYIAKRKLVLKIFQLAISKELECQQRKGKRKQIPHEKFLHNIIFSQHTTDPKESNLWLLSDEFVHYSGVSEKRLVDISYKGKPFLREDLSDEERKSLKHFEHDDITGRPDILLFPEEHKCVIIEFKSTEIELSNQIEQISNYASIIREFSKPEYEVTTFYAYLIGEKFDLNAFMRRNPEFQESYYFKYAYCPDKPVWGGINRLRGSMYIEVIQFSTLLERAISRNKVFTDHI